MGTVLFASDLDNTLLFSRRHRQPGDVCAEWLEGEEQGFMTPWVWETLGSLPPALRLVPVTTRSIAQYRRIRWLREPEMAAVTNGGILLRQGEPDGGWLAAFQREAEGCRKAFCVLEEELRRRPWCLRWKMVDGLYCFAVCEEGPELERQAAEFPVPPPLTAALSGRKLYFLPPKLHKGAAVERLRRELKPETLVCAGDSGLDLPMLALADRALVPEAALARALPPGRAEVCPAGERFSEFVLRRVLELSAGGAAGS